MANADKYLTLAQLMELRGVTQTELARMIEVNRCNIHATIHGRQDISKKIASAIGKALKAQPVIVDAVVRFLPS